MEKEIEKIDLLKELVGEIFIWSQDTSDTHLQFNTLSDTRCVQHDTLLVKDCCNAILTKIMDWVKKQNDTGAYFFDVCIGDGGLYIC
jgi:hypothetical protein